MKSMLKPLHNIKGAYALTVLVSNMSKVVNLKSPATVVDYAELATAAEMAQSVTYQCFVINYG